MSAWSASCSTAWWRSSGASSAAAPRRNREADMKGYLTIEAVGQTFTRGAATTEVLRDVRLVIDRGEYVSIIGHSGCGKSTLLNIVAGLLRATTGEVFLEGEVVDAPGPDRAVVFQNHSLLPWLTSYENVAL